MQSNFLTCFLVSATVTVNSFDKSLSIWSKTIKTLTLINWSSPNSIFNPFTFSIIVATANSFKQVLFWAWNRTWWSCWPTWRWPSWKSCPRTCSCAPTSALAWIPLESFSLASSFTLSQCEIYFVYSLKIITVGSS